MQWRPWAGSPSVPEVITLRLATFNLLHGISLRDGSASVDALRDAAKSLDADVVGLQEVDRRQERTGRVDQTEVVADALDARWWRFAAAVRGTPGTEVPWTAAGDDEHDDEPTYGIGLASRLPVLEWHVRRWTPAPVALPLLTPGGRGLMRVPDEPRLALAAVLEAPSGRPFTVVTAHLSFVPGWNGYQLRDVTRWVRDMPAPRFLAGDLNLPGSLPRLLSGWHQLARVPTYPSYAPKIQFDHVLAQGVEPSVVQRVTAMPLGISDHCALAVDVAL
jgi:endonuclease/exonuclease/phosphatase family metal-dependent hydrolase